MDTLGAFLYGTFKFMIFNSVYFLGTLLAVNLYTVH